MKVKHFAFEESGMVLGLPSWTAAWEVHSSNPRWFPSIYFSSHLPSTPYLEEMESRRKEMESEKIKEMESEYLTRKTSCGIIQCRL